MISSESLLHLSFDIFHNDKPFRYKQEIQNCIIRFKLSSLEHVAYSNLQQVDGAFSPSSNLSLASHSISSNDDEDVLKHAMIHAN